MSVEPRGEPRILISAESAEDAEQILRQVKDEFQRASISIDPDRAAADFEEARPDVLVIAFNSLEKAQRYYLGLYRMSRSVHAHPHHTVLLCDKSEVPAAYDLCKKHYFDDYVLYWPHAYDGRRLSMSIWIACRELTARAAQGPPRAELLAHARHLGELEKTFDREFESGEQQIVAANDSLQQVEREIGGALEEFSSRLSRGRQAGGVDVNDKLALGQAIDELRQRQLAQARRIGSGSFGPLVQWTRGLRGQIAPALAATRALADKVRKTRSVLMVVEDDDVARRLVRLALDEAAYELHFVGDAPGALSLLRRVRPDAILMDIRLPGIDGVSLTERLKASPPLADIPVVMLSGDARRETLVRSREVGAAGFVVKPFTRETLNSRLEKILMR
jgi:CheY-like chemotaxis protein